MKGNKTQKNIDNQSLQQNIRDYDNESILDLKIINKLGLHARAAAKLVEIVNHYDCECHISHLNTKVNAKSIMGVLMLAASQGSTVKICASGSTQELRHTMLRKVKDLVEDYFGEGE